VDDETGWTEILLDVWGPLVLDAVAHQVEQAFSTRRGLLAATALDPDEVDTDWVESVHVAVVAGIAAETGADIEEMGSQSVWAIYDEIWTALASRAMADPAFVVVPEHRVGQVHAIIAELPLSAALHAGGVPWAEGPTAPVVLDGRTRVHLDGVFRWLATDDGAAESHRALARALIAIVRDDPFAT
jgi:hypothetical protein